MHKHCSRGQFNIGTWDSLVVLVHEEYIDSSLVLNRPSAYKHVVSGFSAVLGAKCTVIEAKLPVPD